MEQLARAWAADCQRGLLLLLPPASPPLPSPPADSSSPAKSLPSKETENPKSVCRKRLRPLCMIWRPSRGEKGGVTLTPLTCGERGERQLILRAGSGCQRDPQTLTSSDAPLRLLDLTGPSGPLALPPFCCLPPTLCAVQAPLCTLPQTAPPLPHHRPVHRGLPEDPPPPAGSWQCPRSWPGLCSPTAAPGLNTFRSLPACSPSDPHLKKGRRKDPRVIQGQTEQDSCRGGRGGGLQVSSGVGGGRRRSAGLMLVGQRSGTGRETDRSDL